MLEKINEIISKAIDSAGFEQIEFSIENPPKSEMGDFATNSAMLIAKKAKANPKEIAEKLKIELKKSEFVENIEIAGPGFINIFIKNDVFEKELKKILEQTEDYGRTQEGKNKEINVEYISANPTGPIHVGNARSGPIGELIARLYEFSGYKVTREFYVNDIGGQVNTFADTLYYWYAVKTDPKIVFPENGYKGDYVKELSEKIQEEKQAEISLSKEKEEIVEIFKNEGLLHMLKSIREDALLLGIQFDKWTNQSDAEHSGSSEVAIKELEDAGSIAKREGALWFKNPNDPEFLDKESVLKKSDEDGTLTYFADDIAYHKDKFERGYTKMFNIWGADHHGHAIKLLSALKALKMPTEKLNIIFYQYIRIKEGGELLKLSKRAGNLITLKQVVESGVDPDAYKYFILSQNPNTPIDFDLDLAKDTSEKNPVFYIKYAHARIASILKKAGDREDLSEADLSILNNPKERELLKELIKFPELLEEIKTNFSIQSLPHFAYKIAGLFHDFYASCQVLTDDEQLSRARLSLVTATKHILKNSLNICAIEAPEQM